MKMSVSRKWLLSGATLVFLSTTILAGCSGEAQPPAAAPEGTTPEKPAAEAPAPAEKELPKEFSILLSHANAAYAKAVTDWENDPYVKELERLSGYDLHYEFLGHHPDFIPQLTVRFASGDLPDLIRTDSIDGTAHPQAVELGIFHDLTALIDEYGPNLKSKIPEVAWNSPRVQKDGKIYGIPAIIGEPTSRAVYIRQDWLDAVGMQQPKTLDEYLAFFEEVKVRDMDGNGDPNDEYGFMVRENMAYSELFFGAFGVYPTKWSFVDNQYVPDIIRPEMKEAIAFWKQLYDKGYINENMFTNKGADWAAAITANKAATWVHDASSYSASWKGNMPDANIAMIESPTGPRGDSGLAPIGDSIYFVFVIPSKVEHPEQIIKFLDWAWSSEEADTFFTFGIEGVNYTKENGEIKWDPANPKNATDNEYLAYRLSINLRGADLSTPRVLSLSPDADVIAAGMEASRKSGIQHESLYLPRPEAFNTNPELSPGFGADSLFLDMFAKVVTGREPLDAAFDSFVTEWKSRGGDAAIQQATEWYNSRK
ncbi:extracellular solute-binding protein [Paenibacillus sp.]|uniref:extracellular solute-binding protein n=1 Tax=Paenibacillus sp. TaxID=58172 RepID=UPI002D43CBE3|nr:extracellular solute-binding protein [Paenibacillus sp.]HZG57950.1 extracellular solute-binding protein [Paenibacillus sp.]